MKTVYLYAKQHNITGLRYFGKTTKNPYKYKGSGKDWRIHLKKYGSDISTTWVHAYNDIAILEEEARFLSKVYDVANSQEWANRIIETGVGGGWGGAGEKNGMWKHTHSAESKELIRQARLKQSFTEETFYKISIANMGEKNGMFGKKRPDLDALNKELHTCPHCFKVGRNRGTMKRWHFDNCKFKP